MKRIVCVLLLVPGIVFSQALTRMVDPFIGTANGGNTFPGAVRPWGMVSVSPHNAIGAPSGYLHGATPFSGFGSVHLSGTGCADLGSVIVTATDGRSTHPTCSLANEAASPGYYRADLVEPGILAEATAGTRSGLIRFTPKRASGFAVVIDAGQSLALTGGGAVRMVSPAEIEGYNISGGFCGEANRQTVYFVARCSRVPANGSIWVGDSTRAGSSASADGERVGCRLEFRASAGEPLVVKVGISYTSIDNARRNLDEEVPGWDFEGVRSSAEHEWEAALSRIRVEGGATADSIRFYTALYHALIHPGIISDRSGDYPLMGRTGIGRTAGDRYSVFSLWDTYRTLHPLLTLVYPERQSAIIRTMVGMYKESGWLPKWELAANETYMMVGDAAGPVIADSYVKGIRDFDVNAALEAMLKPGRTTNDSSAPPIRAGYHEYLRYHYIPFDQDTTKEWWVWGPASTTLEYCVADWAIARMASAMGKSAEAQIYASRSAFYKNLFDTASDFIRPRRRNGSWLVPFDPVQTEGSGNWSGSGGPGYVEGNAWQYTWFVPQDIPGLISLFGGPAPFATKLGECFTKKHFTINNEPDIEYPYLFRYARGYEGRTPGLLQEILRRDFGTGPAGLPGNDDAGTISAWFVFTALGLYPECPGSEQYILGVPLFRRARIALDPRYYPGKEFVIEARDGDHESFLVNGSVLQGYRVDHSTVVHGGTLRVVSPPGPTGH